MRDNLARVSWAAAILVVLSVLPARAQSSGSDSGGTIPPLYRTDRHLEEGAGYLRGLADGTRFDVKRADGTAFTLELHGGKVTTQLPPPKLSPDKHTLTSPLGYRLYTRDESPQGFTTEAPNGNYTAFGIYAKKNLIVATKGKKTWSREVPSPFVLRLTDGTRVDTTDAGGHWEALMLDGQRFRYDSATNEWTELAKIPSPPLIPDLDSFYVAADGETWRLPAIEDHVVFAWNWYPVGFDLGKAVEEVKQPPRYEDIKGYFDGLAQPQPPAEMAGYVFGRRLALCGGDQITFRPPSGKADVVFLLPGPIDPDYFELKSVIPTRRGFETKKSTKSTR